MLPCEAGSRTPEAGVLTHSGFKNRLRGSSEATASAVCLQHVHERPGTEDTRRSRPRRGGGSHGQRGPVVRAHTPADTGWGPCGSGPGAKEHGLPEACGAPCAVAAALGPGARLPDTVLRGSRWPLGDLCLSGRGRFARCGVGAGVPGGQPCRAGASASDGPQTLLHEELKHVAPSGISSGFQGATLRNPDRGLVSRADWTAGIPGSRVQERQRSGHRSAAPWCAKKVTSFSPAAHRGLIVIIIPVVRRGGASPLM